MTKKETKQSKKSDFIPESKENIIEGAKVFSEKASALFNSFMEKVKETAETAYEKGTDIFETVALTAENYLEKYKDQTEMSNLEKVRSEVVSKLGNMCYMEYSGRYRFRETFLKSEEFRSLITQIRELDKQIILIGKRLEEEKK